MGPGLGIQSMGSGYLSNIGNNMKGSMAIMQDDKTSSFINYNSKSFNNKTICNHDATTPHNQTQNHLKNIPREPNENFIDGVQQQQPTIGLTSSQEPSPIPKTRVLTINKNQIPNQGSNYGSTNYNIDIIENQYQKPANQTISNDHHFEHQTHQQYQYSELKGSILSPNTNVNTIASLEVEFIPKNINLKNQRFAHNHHWQQSNEKKPRVQVPKIQMNQLQAAADVKEKHSGHLNNMHVQMSQISQISQVSAIGLHQFANTSNTPGSASNGTGFIFARDASNSLQNNVRQNSDGRQPQVDSILFSQKIKMDSEKNINEIQLGNVKNQVLGAFKQSVNHNHAGQNYQSSQQQFGFCANINQSNYQAASNGLIAGREIDRNQLSVEIMNITPIMEEKEYYNCNNNNNFQHGMQTELNEFKIEDYHEKIEETTNLQKSSHNHDNQQQMLANNWQQQINDRSKDCEEDRLNIHDENHQFSFDKQINIVDGHSELNDKGTKQIGILQTPQSKQTEKESSHGVDYQQIKGSLQMKPGNLSELIDIDENNLVRDLEYIDNKFSICQVHSSPKLNPATKQSVSNHQSNLNFRLQSTNNYQSIISGGNQPDQFIFNLFKSNPFLRMSDVSNAKSLELQRFENNLFILKKDFKYYQQILQLFQLKFIILNQAQLVWFIQNIPNIYMFRKSDNKKSFFGGKLANEMANINELSPILANTPQTISEQQNKNRLSHLRFIMSQSILGLCRQHMTVLILVKGIQSSIYMVELNNWLSSLIQMSRNISHILDKSYPGTKSELQIANYLEIAVLNYYRTHINHKLNLQDPNQIKNKSNLTQIIKASHYGGKQTASKNSGQKYDQKQVGVFDHLSSIESEGPNVQFEGDPDEGDVLQVLQRTASQLHHPVKAPSQNSKLTNQTSSQLSNRAALKSQNKLLKNDDAQYKERELRNLSKYRDKSNISVNSDPHLTNIIPNQSDVPIHQNNNLLPSYSHQNIQSSTQIQNNTSQSTEWVDQRGRRKKNRRAKNTKKATANNFDQINHQYQNKTIQINNKLQQNEISNKLLKTPDQKQQNVIENTISHIDVYNKLQGLNTSPTEKQKGDKKKSRTRRGNHKSKSHNKHKFRQESSKSKSKSRFSNNLGFTQLQNAIENQDIDALENTQAMEKLLQAINDEQDQLDQFISHEEENYSKKFNNKLNEAEQILQNSKRDGSFNNRFVYGQSISMNQNHTTAQANTNLSQAPKISAGILDNLQQNQHHNSISNNSGSFYFAQNKKQSVNDSNTNKNAFGSKKGIIKTNNVSMQQKHPYNPRGAHSGSIYGLSAKKDRSSVGVPNGCFNASSSGSSSSGSSSSPKNNRSCGFKSQNLKSISDIDQKQHDHQIQNLQFKNVSTHHNYSVNAQLLTDRPNIDKKLDLGKIKNNLRAGRHNMAVAGTPMLHNKSNDRQLSIVSANSKYSNGNQGMGSINRFNNKNNQSYSNRQRFALKNNFINRSSAAVANVQHHNQTNYQHQQYSSLTRIGIQKFSSAVSGGGYSNQSPSNTNQNQVKLNKLAQNIYSREDQADPNLQQTKKSPFLVSQPYSKDQDINNQIGNGLCNYEIGAQQNIIFLEQTAKSNHNNMSGYSTNLNNQFQSTQNSYRTSGNNMGGIGGMNIQNPILQKLKTAQISRQHAGSLGNTHNISANANMGNQAANMVAPEGTLNTNLGNSMLLQITSDYPLSHRAIPNQNHSSIHQSITPKSIGVTNATRLLAPIQKMEPVHDNQPSQQQVIQGISPKKQMTNTMHKQSIKPILGQIHLERSQTIGVGSLVKQSNSNYFQNKIDYEQLKDESNQLNQSGQQPKHNQNVDSSLNQKNIVGQIQDKQSHNYDKQILIKQNTNLQFDEFKVETKNHKNIDQDANCNTDQATIAVTNQMGHTDLSRNNSKENSKPSVLSIKMRATTSFQGGHQHASGLVAINGAQSSRLPGSHGLAISRVTDKTDDRQFGNANQHGSQMKLRVKSQKKNENTVVSTSNNNSSVSKTSADKIRTSSNSSMGATSSRMLKLKFKPRNFNKKHQEPNLKISDNTFDQEQLRNLEDQYQKASKDQDLRKHELSAEVNKPLSARSGLKIQDKRRDRLARGHKYQHDHHQSLIQDTKSSQMHPNKDQTSQIQISLSKGQPTATSIKSQVHSSNMDLPKQMTASSRIISGNQSSLNKYGDTQSRLKQPGYSNYAETSNQVTNAHLQIRQGLNQDKKKDYESGFASKFRGRERAAKVDKIQSPTTSNQRCDGFNILQNNQKQQEYSKNNSIEKQQFQQHKTLVQNHYYAAASMVHNQNISGQQSARSYQKLNIVPQNRRTAHTEQLIQLDESVSPQLKSRLHLSQQEHSLQNNASQYQNNICSTRTKQSSAERVKLSLVGLANQNQSQYKQAYEMGDHDQFQQAAKHKSDNNAALQSNAHSDMHLRDTVNLHIQGPKLQEQQPSNKHYYIKNDCDRLVELLIGEFKRKKGRNIRADVPSSQQLQTLITFWQESLSKQRILTKLLVKQQTFSSQLNTQMDTMRTATSLPSKLSDKEKWLLNYLEGTDTQQLLTLGKESTTRNYGELAMIDENLLANEICRFLKLDRNSQKFIKSSQPTDCKRE